MSTIFEVFNFGSRIYTAILTHTFYEDDGISLQVKNLNNNAPPSEMTFYLASSPNGTDSTPVVIPALDVQVSIEISAFGVSNYPEHSLLTAVNDTPFVMHYVLELL